MIWVYWAAVKELDLSNYSAGIYRLWLFYLSSLTATQNTQDPVS